MPAQSSCLLPTRRAWRLLARAPTAGLAAEEAASGGRDVLVLAGGTKAWADAGLPMATGFKDQLDDPVDVWYRPYDLDEGNEAAMETYLSWEVDLTEQIARDGTTRFPEFPQ